MWPATSQPLRYVTDSEPGITRHRRGGRSPVFHYRSTQGRRIRDAATLARIRALAIPPAYEDVWICAQPDGHLQATGRDARGRKQYRYHPAWRHTRDEIKHARMIEFGRALPRLRRALRADLARPGLPREKVLALVVSLMDQTCVRVGNSEYVRSNGSFGLSTLLDRHARFAHNGTGVLRFPGKGGLRHEVSIHDTRLAALVRRCQHLPGQHLFQYRDEQGRCHAIDSGGINEYLRTHLGGEFSAKDFRTWHATLRAYRLLLRTARPPGARAVRRALAAVVGEVAAQLRNTAAVCRKSYINPLVLEAWQQGAGPFAQTRAGRGGGIGPLLSLLRRPGGVRPRPGGPARHPVHPRPRAWERIPRAASSVSP
ncbi:MAG TPA: hypothetical protein VMI92_03150 [Steroidobacteraceae bacterium]|nr:hypothetical protein [Steroidobacteraceae bacterium]